MKKYDGVDKLTYSPDWKSLSFFAMKKIIDYGFWLKIE